VYGAKMSGPRAVPEREVTSVLVCAPGGGNRTDAEANCFGRMRVSEQNGKTVSKMAK
jgi:hypothetical protein